MKGFKKFVTEDEDVRSTISKLPKRYQNLVKGFKFLFEPHNTLHDDDDHIGVVLTHPRKIIRIAAPWRYPRETAMLHEIGHLVFEKYLKGTYLQKEWERLVNNTKHGIDETEEEIFCSVFANVFAANKLVKFTYPEWENFVKNLP